MSLRYVWEKLNTASELVLPTTYPSSGYEKTYSGAKQWKAVVWYSEEYTFDGSYITLKNPTSKTVQYGIGTGSVLSGKFIQVSEAVSKDSTDPTYSPQLYSKTYYGVGSTAGINFPADTDEDTQILNINRCGKLTKQTVAGTTSYGQVASASSSAYPNDGNSGSYWYKYKGSDSIDPTAISYPTESIQAGNTLKISLTVPSSNTYGGTITYTYQRSTDGGSTWTQIASTTATSYTDTVPTTGIESVMYRAFAKDNYGFTSTTYATGSAVTVINNTAPVISGSDTNLGSFSNTKPNAWDYSITDADGDSVTVTEAIDGNVKRSYTATLGATNSFSFTDEEWMKVLNGSHTATITVSDGKATSTRTLTFTKSVTSLTAMFNPPLTSDAAVTRAIENITAVVPDGATIKIEVCNNALDASPTWEDVTAKVLEGQKFAIANTTKTADNWAYNVRVTIERGTATGEVSLSGISGFFA